MRRTFACTAALALLLAAPALAKGPSEATVTGPGLDRDGIQLESTTGGDPASGTPLGDLTEFAGFFPATFGQSPDPMLRHRPTGSLGPRYTVVYRVPGTVTSTIRQDLYPYARPSPLTHTRRGQPFFGANTTKGGWYVAPPDLRTTLVTAGLPGRAPSAGSSHDWLPRRETSAIVGALLVLLLTLTVVVHRRRLRPAGT